MLRNLVPCSVIKVAYLFLVLDSVLWYPFLLSLVQKVTLKGVKVLSELVDRLKKRVFILHRPQLAGSFEGPDDFGLDAFVLFGVYKKSRQSDLILRYEAM